MKKSILFILFLFPFVLPAETGLWCLEGKIDEAIPIRVNLIRLDNDLSGYVYLDRVAIPYRLNGTITGKSVSLTESDLKGEEVGKVVATINFDGTWEGSWTQTKQGKVYSFQLTDSKDGLRFKPLFWKESIPLFEGGPEDFNGEEIPNAEYRVGFLEPTNVSGYEPVSKNLAETLLIGAFGPDADLSNSESAQSSLNAYYKSLYAEAADDAKTPSMCFACSWTLENHAEIIYNQNSFLSIGFGSYEFSGGAHGSFRNDFIVYDLKLDRRLHLGDIFANPSDPGIDRAIERVYVNYEEISDETNMEDYGLFVQHLYPSSNFYITHGGIAFHYGLYEIAPYVAGTTDIFVPWVDLKPFLKEGSPLMRLIP